MRNRSFLSRFVTKLVLIGALMGIPFAVRAQSARPETRLTLVFSGVSLHSRDRDIFNWFNYGFGVEYRVSDKFHVSAGAYHNSLRKTTVYAGAGWETRGDRPFGAGIEAGLVTGYDYGVNIKGIKILPAGVPYLRGGSRDGLNVKVNTIPPIGANVPGVMAAQLRWPGNFNKR